MTLLSPVKLVVDLHPKIFEGVHPFHSTVVDMISVGNGFLLVGYAHHLTLAGIQFKLPFLCLFEESIQVSLKRVTVLMRVDLLEHTAIISEETSARS